MLKKLLVKIVGKQLRDKWKLDEPEKVPHAGEIVLSVPWYRSKAKIGFLLYLVAIALKYGPPAFGHPPVLLPPEALDLLQGLGLGVGGYGLRDALKEPAKQLYENVAVPKT